MLRIGSRGSALALWQARWAADRLGELGHECEIEIIKTTGDRMAEAPLPEIGGKGLFTKEIEEALLAGTIDVAVHSLKDLPTELPPGLVIAAVPFREDPRDALAGKRLADLAPGARVGTSSLRRAAQLLALRPDLVVEPVRGNVDTRLRKLDNGDFDAIVLAAAGLRRLGLMSRIAELLAPEIMCPAVGQGALAIETRVDTVGAVDALDHPDTRLAITAERELLKGLGGGCQAPIGGHARVASGVLTFDAVVVSPDGRKVVRLKRVAPSKLAEAAGVSMAEELLESGADEILSAVYGA